MILQRFKKGQEGIFSNLKTGINSLIAVTLEHAYLQSDGSYEPKIPNGRYICVRGSHLLLGMKTPFITYEVMNVPGHTGLLFHCGNLEKESSGCILLGEFIQGVEVMNSKKAFDYFMDVQKLKSFFYLTVMG